MLKKFSVTNYRQFNERLEFDLTASNYAFNQDCVKDDLVKLALIYGENGTGKSNLGWAMYDLISHLTDNEANENKPNYLNAFSNDKYATFKFEFLFSYKSKFKNLIYEYRKDEKTTLVSEKLSIDNETIIDYQLGQPFTTSLSGAENLNKNINPAQNLSSLKYIFSNTNLDKRNANNSIYIQFMEYINHILYCRNVFGSKIFTGYRNGLDNIEQDILTRGNLKDFEKFLKSCQLNFQLTPVRQLNKQIIGIKMGKKVVSFFDVISTGTLSLTFFYYWWQEIKENKIPLLFIDEFDCSFHFALSEQIVAKLKELPNTQVILTTHNTNLLSNELIRPDCAYVIDGSKIKSLKKATNKEIREIHNLERLYQAGEFDSE